MPRFDKDPQYRRAENNAKKRAVLRRSTEKP